jgi:hypothetical protein
MNSIFLLRLALNLLAVCLLVFGLSYWRLGNVVHELAGTAMFILLIAHNVFNRRWYGTIPRTRREARATFNVVVTAAPLLGMVVLLVTSVLISEALAGLAPYVGGFTARQLHTFAAYWVLAIVGIHLGLRWPVIMGVASSLSGISWTNPRTVTVLRATSALIAIYGVWSSFELGLGAKLAMQVSLDWWNFEESVARFFIHCAAIAGLYIFATYYAMKLIRHPSVARLDVVWRRVRHRDSAAPRQVL